LLVPLEEERRRRRRSHTVYNPSLNIYKLALAAWRDLTSTNSAVQAVRYGRPMRAEHLLLYVLQRFSISLAWQLFWWRAG